MRNHRSALRTVLLVAYQPSPHRLLLSRSSSSRISSKGVVSLPMGLSGRQRRPLRPSLPSLSWSRHPSCHPYRPLCRPSRLPTLRQMCVTSTTTLTATTQRRQLRPLPPVVKCAPLRLMDGHKVLTITKRLTTILIIRILSRQRLSIHERSKILTTIHPDKNFSIISKTQIKLAPVPLF